MCRHADDPARAGQCPRCAAAVAEGKGFRTPPTSETCGRTSARRTCGCGSTAAWSWRRAVCGTFTPDPTGRPTGRNGASAWTTTCPPPRTWADASPRLPNSSPPRAQRGPLSRWMPKTATVTQRPPSAVAQPRLQKPDWARSVRLTAANRDLTAGGFDRRRSDRYGGTLIFACRVPGGTAPSGTGVARECQAWRWPVHVQARHAHSRIGSAGRVTIRICRDPGPASYRRDHLSRKS